MYVGMYVYVCMYMCIYIHTFIYLTLEEVWSNAIDARRHTYVCMHVHNDSMQHISLNTSQQQTSPNNTAFLIAHAPSKQTKLMRILFSSCLAYRA